MSAPATVVTVYDDMGHLMTRDDAPEWFELYKYINSGWLSSRAAWVDGYVYMINTRACESNFFTLDTLHGQVTLDLSALPYEQK